MASVGQLSDLWDGTCPLEAIVVEISPRSLFCLLLVEKLPSHAVNL